MEANTYGLQISTTVKTNATQENSFFSECKCKTSDSECTRKLNRDQKGNYLFIQAKEVMLLIPLN